MSDSVRALLKSFPAPAYPFVADGLDVRESRVGQWAARNAVPAEYWAPLVALAKAAKVADVNLERLARLHARRTPPRLATETANA